VADARANDARARHAARGPPRHLRHHRRDRQRQPVHGLPHAARLRGDAAGRLVRAERGERRRRARRDPARARLGLQVAEHRARAGGRDGRAEAGAARSRR